MGAAGRERVLAEFGWPAIAQQTVQVYEQVLAARR
jgi:starch synthase